MKFTWRDKEWYIDGFLADALRSLCYNLKNDWDFVLLITGDRSVRVGKSVLAMVCAAFLASVLAELKWDKNKNNNYVPMNLQAYGIDNIFFDNKKLVDKAQGLPQYSIVHYDEGREGLAANKSMKSFQQDLLDFFAECGQLNHIFIIVCPDFFELKENIAVARSEFLINVWRKDDKVMKDGHNVTMFRRGYFEFFNKKGKQLLFDMAKSTRRKQYSLVKPQFKGRFTDQYPVGELEYKTKKKDSLSRFKERHLETIKEGEEQVLRNHIIMTLHNHGNKGTEISKILLESYNVVFSDKSVNSVIRKEKLKAKIKESELIKELTVNETEKEEEEETKETKGEKEGIKSEKDLKNKTESQNNKEKEEIPKETRTIAVIGDQYTNKLVKTIEKNIIEV